MRKSFIRHQGRSLLSRYYLLPDLAAVVVLLFKHRFPLPGLRTNALVTARPSAAGHPTDVAVVKSRPVIASPEHAGTLVLVTHQALLTHVPFRPLVVLSHSLSRYQRPSTLANRQSWYCCCLATTISSGCMAEGPQCACKPTPLFACRVFVYFNWHTNAPSAQRFATDLFNTYTYFFGNKLKMPASFP
jgi:hypothetical protein